MAYSTEQAEIKCEQVSTSFLVEVAQALGKDWKRLGRQLDLPEYILEAIEEDYGRSGVQEMAYQLLLQWKQIKPKDVTRSAIELQLTKIGRLDILSSTSSSTSIPTHFNTYDHQRQSSSTNDLTLESRQGLIKRISSSKLKSFIFKNVRRNLKNEYQCLQMKGLPWMTDVVLTLDEYFVELTMMNCDKKGQESQNSVQINHLFKSTERNTKPYRILIESGPGMGKTTCSAKIAFDWATKKSYVKRFDLVILLPLRQCTGDLEDMVCRASHVTKEDKNYFIKSVSETSKCILFILDGYDEASSETKKNISSLLCKEIYAHIYVIVTSRTGKFTANHVFETQRQSGIMLDADVRPTGYHFLDKRVTLEGLSVKQQEIFVSKHMNSYSKEQVQQIKDKLKIVELEFCECPLFLLMLIIVFTTNEDAVLINTKTELYKHVVNCVIRRYVSKTSRHPVANIDLFSYEGKDKPLHIKLMSQFSNFAVWAMKSEKLYFLPEDILKCGETDTRILDLGFLSQTISLKGFQEKVFYEPVHKSLMEFAAAYGLWIKFIEETQCYWENEVVLLRPQLETASSLLFPFLVGLMSENAPAVFNALVPYASEYTCWFGTLGFSLLEIQMTNPILISLTPFIPAEWLVKWFPDDHGFSCSPQHEELIRWGVTQGKIKVLRWDILLPARLPQDVMLDTVVFSVSSYTSRFVHSDQKKKRTSTLSMYLPRIPALNFSHKSIHCRHLWCHFLAYDQSDMLWETCLHLLEIVDYQHLSFDFPFLLHWFPCIHNAVTEGKLENIHRIKTYYRSQNADSTKSLSEILNMIADVRIRALELHLDRNSEQKDIDLLIKLAGTSRYMTNFVLNRVGDAKASCFSVDLTQLFNEGKKLWDVVRLENIEVQCPNIIKPRCALKLLDINMFHDRTRPTPENVFCSFQASSFTCHSSILGDITKALPHINCITEVNIPLNKSVFDHGLQWLPIHLKQLKTLALIVTSFEYDAATMTSTQWLMGSSGFVRLKGLEIWNIEENTAFSVQLLTGIVQLFYGTFNDISIPEQQLKVDPLCPKGLQVDYLLLRTELTRDPKKLTHPHASTPESTFMATLLLLKNCLVENVLPRLHMVHVVRYKHFWPKTFGSWMGIFPPTEGFRVYRDLWGMKENDSIYSREMCHSCPGKMERISIVKST